MFHVSTPCRRVQSIARLHIVPERGVCIPQRMLQAVPGRERHREDLIHPEPWTRCQITLEQRRRCQHYQQPTRKPEVGPVFFDALTPMHEGA